MFNMGDTINTSTPFLDLRRIFRGVIPKPAAGF